MKLNKTNIIDIATVLVLITIVALGAVYYLRKPAPETTKLNVVVEISDPAQAANIAETASVAKLVYLNSINVPVSATSANQGSALQITLSGPGHMDANGFYYFNGQRLLVGQKAEIHGSYFAQGTIVKIENAK